MGMPIRWPSRQGSFPSPRSVRLDRHPPYHYLRNPRPALTRQLLLHPRSPRPARPSGRRSCSLRCAGCVCRRHARFARVTAGSRCARSLRSRACVGRAGSTLLTAHLVRRSRSRRSLRSRLAGLALRVRQDRTAPHASPADSLTLACARVRSSLAHDCRPPARGSRRSPLAHPAALPAVAPPGSRALAADRRAHARPNVRFPGGLKGRGALAAKRSRSAGPIRTTEGSEDIPQSDRERAEGFQDDCGAVDDFPSQSSQRAESFRGGCGGLGRVCTE